MARKFKTAVKGLKKFVADTLKRYHEGLADAGVEVDVMLAWETEDEEGEHTPVLRRHGHPVHATIRVMPLAMRTLGNADALLTLDSTAWEQATEGERVALVDQQLEFLELIRDKHGDVKLDEHGRPKLRMCLPDWYIEGFHAIVRRHGDLAPEVKRVRSCRDEKTGQYFWDFAGLALAAAAE